MHLERTIALTPLVTVHIEIIRPPQSADPTVKRPLVADHRCPFPSVRFHFYALRYAPVTFDWYDLFPRPNGLTPLAGQGTYRLPDRTTLSTRLLAALEVNTWVLLSHYGLLARLSPPPKAA